MREFENVFICFLFCRARRSVENGAASLIELLESKPLTKVNQLTEGSLSDHSLRLRRSAHDTLIDDDMSQSEELAAEEQRIKNEINVVQNVEYDMEEELRELNEQRPSKLVHSEKKNLQHEQDTLNQVESDLMRKEESIEKKLEEYYSDTGTDFDQSYEKDDTEVSDYEDESDPMAEYAVEDYSYDGEDQEGMYRPKRNAHFRSYLTKLCEKKMKSAPKQQTKFWINFCKGRKRKHSKKPSRKAQSTKPVHVNKKNRHQKHRPTDQTTKADHIKNKHHNRKPHLTSSKSANVPQLTYSGGKNERCQRCEQKVGEEVCGSNGKTYNSLCQAVNCAGLNEDDVNAGPCSEKESNFTFV